MYLPTIQKINALERSVLFQCHVIKLLLLGRDLVQQSVKLYNVFHKSLLQLWSLHLEGWCKQFILNSKAFREQYNSLHL